MSIKQHHGYIYKDKILNIEDRTAFWNQEDSLMSVWKDWNPTGA